MYPTFRFNNQPSFLFSHSVIFTVVFFPFQFSWLSKREISVLSKKTWKKVKIASLLFSFNLLFIFSWSVQRQQILQLSVTILIFEHSPHSQHLYLFQSLSLLITSLSYHIYHSFISIGYRVSNHHFCFSYFQKSRNMII